MRLQTQHADWAGLMSSQEEDKTLEISVSEGHRGKNGVFKLGREESPETSHDTIYILDIQSPGLWRNKF